ncbi:MAG: Gfo/Idh/MocA family oxidoreductase [Bacillota bacterium]|nr:Gfo/Idh/MocA family oxidoreductase [Bacillota bacterium]
MATKALKLGLIGLGQRARQVLGEQLLHHPLAAVHALCDRDPERLAAVRGGFPVERRPLGCATVNELLDTGIDLLLVFTMWDSHIDLCLRSMRRGIPVACEVGAAHSLEELDELVRVQRETGVPLHYLENCCYGSDALLLLRLVREGVLGSVVHAEGLYINDGRRLYAGEVSAMGGNRAFRRRNADLYPTHVLGPLAMILGVNRGNRILTVSSFASKSRGLDRYLADRGIPDSGSYDGGVQLGDHVSTVLQLSGGETVLLQSSMTLPGDYECRLGLRGSLGAVDLRSRLFYDAREGRSMAVDEPAWRAAREHALWRDRERRAGDFRPIDGMLFDRVLRLVAAGLEPDIDVRDMATWRAVTVLSERSIAAGGAPQAMPDYTRGAWMARPPWDPEPL